MNRERTALIGILAVGLGLRLLYIFAFPLYQAADEYPHFHYIQHLGLTHALPRSTPQYPEYEGFQPPLYYFLSSLVYAPLARYDRDRESSAPLALILPESERAKPPNSLALFFRVLSTLLAVVTLYVVYLISRNFFPDSAGLRLASVAWVAVLPAYATNTAAITNDALAVLVGALLILFLVRQSGWDSKIAFGFGILTGLGALTKHNLLIFLPAGIVAPFFFQSDKRGKAMLTFGLGFVATTFFWYWHNWQTYGSLLAINPDFPTASLFDVRRAQVLQAVRNLARSFWLAGGINYKVMLPVWVYVVVFGGLSLLALSGWVQCARHQWPEFRQGLKQYRIYLLLAILLIFASLFYSLSYPPGRMTSWGKNLFPLLPLWSFFFVGGWKYFWPRAGLGLVWSCVFLLVIVNLVYLFGCVIPYYST